MSENSEIFENFLYEKIKIIASGKGYTGDIRECLNLFTEDVIDSLSFLNLLMESEKCLGKDIDLSDVDPQRFITFAGLVDCFQNETAGK